MIQIYIFPNYLLNPKQMQWIRYIWKKARYLISIYTIISAQLNYYKRGQGIKKEIYRILKRMKGRTIHNWNGLDMDREIRWGSDIEGKVVDVFKGGEIMKVFFFNELSRLTNFFSLFQLMASFFYRLTNKSMRFIWTSFKRF